LRLRFALCDVQVIAPGKARIKAKEHSMQEPNSVVAVFTDHEGAEAAVKMLAAHGIDIKHLSVVGRGYHSDEKVTGFYNSGDRVKFWGKSGAFWGGLWGWLVGGVFVTAPVVGPVVVVGFLASAVISAIEGAVVVGGLSALGAALYGLGIPKNSIVAYEADVSADKFLVLANGSSEEMVRAKALLASAKPMRIDQNQVAMAA
jgi:hypothetical protein